MTDKVSSVTTVIPSVDLLSSGQKFVNKKGFHAVKDGIKEGFAQENNLKKPSWLRVKMTSTEKLAEIKRTVRANRLSTVCEEAKCPNLGECWSSGTATIMLMGDICTRACKFCAVDTGNPQRWLDHEEPRNTARAVQLMNLKYVVLTSVNRDDLSDGGASHYAECVTEVKRLNSNTAVEALTPDFKGVERDIYKVVDSGIDVFAQNLETVERLTVAVRDTRAGYAQTINVLEIAKSRNPKILTKTSLMLGLGESEREICRAMDDILAVGVDILTLGQYLQPTKFHYPVNKFVSPEEFLRFRELGLQKGFKEVVSGPLVRSSYRAERALQGNNVGL
ncbi:MAG: lipoyl synthase [Halieaceae bacterium]|nr:lipoyl synthase [Halieaceae bacterium]